MSEVCGFAVWGVFLCGFSVPAKILCGFSVFPKFCCGFSVPEIPTVRGFCPFSCAVFRFSLQNVAVFQFPDISRFAVLV